MLILAPACAKEAVENTTYADGRIMIETQKVAIVGASGIGKHHAKWWDMEGAEVCGFVGTSPESVAETHEVLEDLFGFDGRGYTELGELLEAESPGIVDVCCPPEFHYEHCLRSLQAGCHVLCEKPFVYDPDLSSEELLEQARTLVKTAREGGLRLGMCSQYYVSARCCMEVLRQQLGDQALQRFRGRLSSPVRGRPPVPEQTWADLGPHMLAGAQAVVPRGKLDPDSVARTFSDWRAAATFTLEAPEGRSVACELDTDRTQPHEERTHVREFTLNDSVFTIGAGTDEEGVYCAEIETPWGSFQYPDAMRMTVREFLAQGPPMDGAAATTNLARMLTILGR